MGNSWVIYILGSEVIIANTGIGHPRNQQIQNQNCIIFQICNLLNYKINFLLGSINSFVPVLKVGIIWH